VQSPMIVALCSLIIPVAAYPESPLKLSVATDKPEYRQIDKIAVLVTITNTGTTPLTLPVLSDAALPTYLTVTVTRSSGSPVFSTANSGVIASALRTIPPGQSITVIRPLNEKGAGYKTSSKTKPIGWMPGEFLVRASLTVTPGTLPTSRGSGQQPYVGTVSSLDRNVEPPRIKVVPVTCADKVDTLAAFGKKRGEIGYSSTADVNQDGVVDILDLAAIAHYLRAGERCN